MTTVVLPNGTEVVYSDDNKVTIRSHGANVVHVVVQLVYLLALVGPHFEVRRRRGTETTRRNESLVLGNNPLGQYVLTFLRSYQQRFGPVLDLPHQITLRPGLESTFKFRLRLVPVEAPTNELRLDSAFMMQRIDGTPLTMEFGVFDELMNVLAVEVLAPMMRRHQLSNRVNRAASRNEGWAALFNLRGYNRTLIWAMWLVLVPIKAIRRALLKSKLADQAAVLGEQLESVFADLQARVDAQRQASEAAIRDRADTDAQVAEARRALAGEQEGLQQGRRALDADRLEFVRVKAEAELAHQKALQLVLDELTAATQLASSRNQRIQQLEEELRVARAEAENYRLALTQNPQVPPQGE